MCWVSGECDIIINDNIATLPESTDDMKHSRSVISRDVLAIISGMFVMNSLERHH